MRVLKRQRLVKSLLTEVADGAHPEFVRFLPRRRIEQTWGVSTATACYALRWLSEQGVVQQLNRKRTVLAGGALQLSRQLLQAEMEHVDALPSRQLGTAPGEGGVKALLFEYLTKSLLEEIASGVHREGQRFLSRRKIQQMWKVSRETASRAQLQLRAYGLLRRQNGNYCFLKSGAVNRACVLLQQMPFRTLTPPTRLITTRNRLLYGDGQPERYRLGVIYRSASVTPESIRLAASSLTFEELGDQLVPRRELVSFVMEAAQHSCGTELFQYGGEPLQLEQLIPTLKAARLDGVALMELNGHPRCDELLSAVQGSGIPVVTALNNLDGQADSSVECNDSAAGYSAMRVLLQHGHRIIIMLDKALHAQRFLLRRKAGAKACLANSGLAESVRLFYRYPNWKKRGAVRRSLKPLFADRRNRPTALLLLDTMPLAEVDRFLHAEGMRVPTDLSLIACGPRGYKTQYIPQPDIMDWDSSRMGVETARQLIRMIHGDPVSRTVQIAPPYLSRGTVIRAPSRA